MLNTTYLKIGSITYNCIIAYSCIYILTMLLSLQVYFPDVMPMIYMLIWDITLLCKYAIINIDLQSPLLRG